MTMAPWTRGVRRRLCFLLLANATLLTAIWLLLQRGGSFVYVLERAGPDAAPVVLAGIGLTGVIFSGAIDLSIASIIALAGTVFGILVHYGAQPLVCFGACFAVAWSLSALNGLLVRTLR